MSPLVRAAFLLLVSGTAAAGGRAGRDFVPNDWAREGLLDVDGASAYSLVDVVVDGGNVWVLYIDPAYLGSFRLDRFDPATGRLAGAASTVFTHDARAGSVEQSGINSGQIGRCAAVAVTDDPLWWDGSRWRTTHIGVDANTVTVRGSGGACPFVAMAKGSEVPGYLDGTALTLDGFSLQNGGSCTGFTADYSYSTCSFAGAAAYRCPVVPDPVADGDAELGACRYLMMYEAARDGDADPTTPDDRALLVAHARDLAGTWKRYLPSRNTIPAAVDVRVANTSQHTGFAPANENSFVSVPTLWYDDAQRLWRMWFVTEDVGRPSVRYTESDDDGRSWGVGGGSGGGIDCWDGAAFDSGACEEIAWRGALPPDSTDGDDTRSPDAVDPEVYVADLGARAGAELAMMVTGGDGACADADWGVQLVQFHHEGGDQSNGDAWKWVSSTAADPTWGVVLDKDRSTCGGAKILDPEIVRWRGGYLAFFNASGGVHAAASGYGCSNFDDDDGDGDTDWSEDGGCAWPWSRE